MYCVDILEMDEIVAKQKLKKGCTGRIDGSTDVAASVSRIEGRVGFWMQ